MRDWLWAKVARILAHDRVANALLTYAKRHGRADHLGGYMHRYWLTPTRWGVGRLKMDCLFFIRLHVILSHDKDIALHDHPWNFRSVILAGAYYEQDVFRSVRIREPGDTYTSQAERFHRIVKLRNGKPVMTLVIGGKWRNLWGFLTTKDSIIAQKVYYKDYSSPNGRTD